MKKLNQQIKAGTLLEDESVLITFDDGYRDNYEVVLPILERNKIKGLFFLLPKYLGKQNLWNTRAEVLLDHLTTEQARTLLDYGHTIGSHGLTHHRLTKFDDEQIRVELIESKILLEDMLQVAINCFAYPYGGTNQQVISLARQIYNYSFATDQAPVNWSDSDFAQIRREFVWPKSSVIDIEDLVVHFGTYDNNPYKGYE